MAERELEQQDYASRLAETAAQLTDSATRLERASCLLPTDEDFYFYSNFSEFREPVQAVQARIQGLLSQISSLNAVKRAPALPSDPDDLLDWLVSTQDELLEQVDSAFDYFKKERAQQGLPSPENDAFMYQNTRKKRRGNLLMERKLQHKDHKKAVSMAEKKVERRPIPFHVWSIPRPQEKFDTPVDNSNTPFKHSKHNAESDVSVHPLQDTLESMEFEGMLDSLVDPRPPASLNDMQLTFVNTPSLLMDVATKLAVEREIAVDLENHQFRSFQGLTCLMQISTRSEDFIIDTLELRSMIGPYLCGVFANPAIQKVIHGANWDVLWLQRDFGIYICNLFDTGQAARVLELQSFGLAYLLERFCQVIPDKRYQMADWRLRPLPVEMLKYAREDTHYLLYIADLLKQMLVSFQSEDQKQPLLEVYKRSRDICLKLYEKEITTETSYLQIYGLAERNFQPQQLAVVSGLYSWRDQVARREDESTGYVLPNHLLLKLAEEMPDDVKKVRALLQGRHILVARNIGTIVEIIKSKSAFLNLESQENVTKQAGKSKPSAVFEEIAFPESIPNTTEITEDVIMLEQDDEARDIKAGRVTVEIQSLQKTSPVQLSENTAKDCLTEVSSDTAHKSFCNAHNEVINKRAKSSSCGKEQVRQTSLEVAQSQGDTNFEALYGVMALKDRSTESDVAGMIGAPTAPSGAILRRASGSSLFLNTKKSSRTVQHVPNLPVTTSEKLKGSFDKGPGEAIPTLLDTTSFHADAKGNVENEDHEQAKAKLQAQRIRASFSLPFHSFDGGNSEPVARERKEVADQPLDKNAAAQPELQETEDIIPVEADASEFLDDQKTTEALYTVSKGIAYSGDGVQYRVWWPDSLGTNQELPLAYGGDASDPRGLETEMPLSLSQKYRRSQHQRERLLSEPQSSTSRKNEDTVSEFKELSSLSSLQQSMKESDGVGVPSFKPFDYAAAKKSMGFLKEHDNATLQAEGPSNVGSVAFNEGASGTSLGSSEKIFDPQRRVKEFKPEGISPGRRRQVFPQSGNRTGVFK